MFAYIKGILDTKQDTFVVIDVQGIGYKIFMPTNSIQNLGREGETVKVFTHYYVREDNISLYGFSSNEELRMFELLISVSGVGAKSAIAMLSEITPSKFALDVVSDDITSLTKIPGVGKKTAARIILELKDKLKQEQAIEAKEEITTLIKNNGKVEEAISALQVLGYNKREIEKAFEKVDIQDLELEEIIKVGLKYLGKN
ncbi:MAG: Holliday junction branch migration protein RuvA [Clostridia bacterium]|nr:Holliday junction branch migration protein RuvA [Clostridia bacterium]